jgi:ectoine hydroxylase-related dioxygenase (phytanoyl-CoA dioxygenase family)
LQTCRYQRYLIEISNLLTIEQGSVLIFGAYLAHRSGDNNTDKSRVAIYLTYNAAREGDKRDHYYDEKRRLFPPASDREEGKNYGELFSVDAR